MAFKMNKVFGPEGLVESPVKQTDYQKKERERISKMGPQVDNTPEGRGEATRTIDKIKSAVQAPFSDKTYGDFKKEYRGKQKQKHAEQVEARREWAGYWMSKL